MNIKPESAVERPREISEAHWEWALDVIYTLVGHKAWPTATISVTNWGCPGVAAVTATVIGGEMEVYSQVVFQRYSVGLYVSVSRSYFGIGGTESQCTAEIKPQPGESLDSILKQIQEKDFFCAEYHRAPEEVDPFELIEQELEG